MKVDTGKFSSEIHKILNPEKLLNIIFGRKGLLMVAIILMVACKGNENKDIPENAINPSIVTNPVSANGNKNEIAPVFKFETDVHDFGTIAEGEKISFAFRFTNVGKSDLVIRAAQGSCGCTVPEFPKEAIKPGGGGIINVTFNSSGKEGEQHKTVDIISNTVPNVYKLYINGNVQKGS